MNVSQALVLVAVLIAPTAIAQTSRPAMMAAPAPQAFEDEPLRAAPSKRAPALAPAAGTSAAPRTGPDAMRVVLALALVIGAIFLLRFVGRKMFLLPGGAATTKGVKVLSRSVLAPKQQVLLLQVGRRVIVVGDSGGNMTPLCEISDSDEVAALLGQLQANRPEQTTSKPPVTFGGLFNRAKEPFEAVDEEPTPNVEPAPEIGLATHSDIGGLMERIRLMKGQFKK